MFEAGTAEVEIETAEFGLTEVAMEENVTAGTAVEEVDAEPTPGKVCP